MAMSPQFAASAYRGGNATKIDNFIKVIWQFEEAETSSQAPASAAWGQTWEMRIPVCSAIDSAEVNLAWKENWQKVESLSVNETAPGVLELQRCTHRRKGQSLQRRGRGWRRWTKPGIFPESSFNWSSLAQLVQSKKMMDIRWYISFLLNCGCIWYHLQFQTNHENIGIWGDMLAKKTISCFFKFYFFKLWIVNLHCDLSDFLF